MVIISAPIYEKMLELKKRNDYPLHMPGHKRNADFFAKDVFGLDFTEIGENDNLHSPHGIIKQAEAEFAALMGADCCKMLVNGGSSGVMAAIISVVNEGEYVLAAANCHKSVHNALVISGAVPVYISPELSPEGIAGGICCKDVENAFDLYDIKAVVITSPSYEGFVSDIEAIAKIVHSRNAILIVDETHGAHFPFHEKFPVPAIRLGADITVESWHKTLPAINQSALLCVNCKKVDFERVCSAFSLVTTTSPSYIMLSQMDYARDMLQKNPQIFNRYMERLLKIRSELAECRTLELISYKGKYSVFDEDISKLAFAVNSSISGVDAAEILRREYGFLAELAAPRHIIAMTSAADDLDRLDDFAAAVADLERRLEYMPVEGMRLPYTGVVVPELTPRQAFYSKIKKVNIENAAGCIAAAAVTPYPPDIPIIMQGEKITAGKIAYIKNCLDSGISVLGVEDGMISCCIAD